MDGWIKISRSITLHWLWEDAERLKWWLDLLVLASWDENTAMHDTHLIQLKKGQMIMSVTDLANRWKRTPKTVLKFLQLLQADNMIERETLHRQTAIITICNYERYQCVGEAIGETIVHTITKVSPYSPPYPPIYSLQNIKRKTTTTTARVQARAYEGVGADAPDVDECGHDMSDPHVRGLLNEGIWLEQIAMCHKIPPDDLPRRIREFAVECQCNDLLQHESLTDAKRHFNAWLRIRLEKEKQQKDNETRRETQRNYSNDRSRRKGGFSTPEGEEAYEGAF